MIFDNSTHVLYPLMHTETIKHKLTVARINLLLLGGPRNIKFVNS